jgi:inorganic triphosphatase YgiF
MCETVSPGRVEPPRASTLHAVKETVEREVKLAAGEGFTLPELGGEVRPTRIFVSTYHDTADLALARHGITFRHRVEDGAGVWQLKLPRAGETRVELERGGPPAVPPPELAGLLAALLRTGPLVPVARLRTRREVVRASGAEVVDDSVAVLDRQRVTRRFREIEVELLDGDEDTLRRLEQALRRAGADGGDFTPKLYRALDLVYPSEPLTVPEDAAPAEALALRLREQATALVSRDPGTRLGSDPEDLHQLRVATRRLRAYLRAARPLLAALGSDRYLALLDRLDAYTASPPLAGGGETLAAIWWVEAKRLRRAVEALGDAPEDEALHAVRIKVKRARYAAELAAHELGERGARYVARAKQAQDVLGAHQDASVAEAEIHAWAAGRPELAEAAGRLAAAERERRREARAAWPEAWERLARAARRARR